MNKTTNECIEYSKRGNKLVRYPQIKRNYVPYYVHRLICAITHNLPYTGDWVARHTCDNPCCVRVEHLIPGTQADNVEDMRKKGVGVKITREQVALIREDTRSQRVIAAEYGVTQTQIHNIQAYKQRGIW